MPLVAEWIEWSDLIFTSLLPAFLIFMGNLVIVQRLIVAARRRTKMSAKVRFIDGVYFIFLNFALHNTHDY